MKEEKIKVLALLPMELPKEIELDNTLEAMQKFVGGLIECITLSDTGSAVTLVCNDEGKLLGLPLNRPLWDGADVLDKVENRGIAKGKAEGEDTLALLMKKLFDQNRIEDAKRASEDKEYRARLMKEFGIS